MAYILIEPANKYSVRNVQRIVNLLRSYESIHDHTIFDLEVNGCDEWTIEISCDNEEGELALIEFLIETNPELFKNYERRNTKWIR